MTSVVGLRQVVDRRLPKGTKRTTRSANQIRALKGRFCCLHLWEGLRGIYFCWVHVCCGHIYHGDVLFGVSPLIVFNQALIQAIASLTKHFLNSFCLFAAHGVYKATATWNGTAFTTQDSIDPSSTAGKSLLDRGRQAAIDVSALLPCFHKLVRSRRRLRMSVELPISPCGLRDRFQAHWHY